MRPLTKMIVAGTAAALMGGTALAQQFVLVPGPDGQGAAAGEEQRFILVPAPRFAPGQEAQAGAGSSTAVELYRRGYRQGVADAERSGASRQQMDPAAIERIGRELFERGYVLGMMQAQLQTGQGQAGQGGDPSAAAGQGAAQQGSDQARAARPGNQQAMAQQGQQGTAQQGGQQATAQKSAGQQSAQQTGQQTGQQGSQQTGQQLVESQVGATAETDMPDATIGSTQSQQYGQYLVDDNGRAVYMFTADKQAQGDAQKAVSNCQDDCAAAWPPVLSQSDSANATGAAQPDLVGTVERQDGTTQVTYDGWPLYYYVEDQGQAQATGQDVHGFGGEWYLLTPEGEKVGEG